MLPPPNKPSRRSPGEPFKRLSCTIRRLLTRLRGTTALKFTPAPGENDQDVQHPVAADKRRNPRIHLAGTTVHVTDGCLFATALIDDISLCGIRLCNLPEQLYRSSQQLTVFSSENPGLPILHIQPKWETTTWEGKTIGAAILNVSDTWRLFLLHNADHIES